jgi:hypothetical protein
MAEGEICGDHHVTSTLEWTQCQHNPCRQWLTGNLHEIDVDVHFLPLSNINNDPAGTIGATDSWREQVKCRINTKQGFLLSNNTDASHNLREMS